MRLGKRLFLRIVISAAVLAAAAFTSYREIENAELVVKNQVSTNAFSANRNVHILLDSGRTALDTVAYYIDVADGRITPSERLDAALDLANKSQLFVIGIIVLDSEGNAVATAHPRTGLGVSYASGDFFQALKNDPGKRFAFGSPRYSQVFKEVLVPLARPIRDIEGAFLGVIAVGISFPEIQKALRPASEIGDAKSRLWRDDGLLLASSENDQTEIGIFYPNIPLPGERLSDKDSGTFVAHSPLNNETRISAWRNNFSYPVFVSSGTNRAPAMFRAYYTAAAIMFAALCLLALIWAIAYLADREIRQRERSIEDLRISRDKAQRSEDGLRRVLESASDGIVILDSTMTIRSFNGAAERIFGRREADLLGQSLDLLLPPEIRGAHSDLIRGFAAGQEQGRQMGSRRGVRGQHSDGYTLPLTITISKAGAQRDELYLAVVRDMSETIAYENQLVENAKEQEQLRVKAEQASRAKSLFLATMSHELRTPLNAIIGFSEALLGGVAGPVVPDKQREYLGYVLESGRHLLEVFNDIIDISRLQSGTHVVHLENVNIAEAVGMATTMLRARFEQKGIVFESESADDAVEGIADIRALRQILINILGNAIKFSPEGGRITCTWGRNACQVFVRVCDEGPGISPDVARNMGLPFNQDRRLHESNNDGLGLGLAISTALARSMNGRIVLRNGPHVGLEATVELDCADSVGERARAVLSG